MNTAHWHVFLNLVPVIGTVSGILLLALGFVLRNNATVKHLALVIFMLSALVAIPAFIAGEAPGDFATYHIATGKAFLAFAVVLGIFSVITLVSDKKKINVATGLYVVTLLLSFGAIVYAKQGISGSEARNTEIRKSAIEQTEQSTTQNAKTFNNEK